MPQLPGRTITLFGRFQSYPRNSIASAIKDKNGRILRELSDRTTAFIVGRGSVIYAKPEALEAKLDKCRRLNIPVLSERAAAEAVGLVDELSTGVPVEIITSKANLSPDEIEYLRIFDVVSVRDGQALFRDAQRAEMVGSLLSRGKTLPEVVKAFHQLGDDHRLKITTAPNGDLAIEWGDQHTTLTGQGMLPFNDDTLSIEELFEAALEAETQGDLETARRLYEVCARADKRDAIATFNLGNVCSTLGLKAEAKLNYHKTIDRDNSFAEAHYNLALMAEEATESKSARMHLQAALDVDPTYPDALYNLALLEFQSNKYTAAIPLFRKFLKVEEAGPWADRAQKALKICQVQASN